MLQEQEITIHIKLYNPESEVKKTETFTITTNQNSTLLEALDKINNIADKCIAYRHSCRMGICGSCGAVINGKPALLCQTIVKDLKQPITIEPLKNLPVIKDLVVDIEKPMDNFRKAFPYTEINKSIPNDDLKNTKQTPKEKAKYEQFSQCIKCFLCYSACPIVGLRKEFIGPAVANAAYRYNQDSRDKLKDERFDAITKEDGIYNCSFIGECSLVCPKKVDPALALQKLKLNGVFHNVKKALKKNKKQ